MDPEPGARPAPRRASGDPRGGLPPRRRPGRRGHRPAPRPAPPRPGPSVPALVRHRCAARPAPGAARVDRPLRRALRRRVGRVARARPSPASRSWASSRPSAELSTAPEWVEAWDDIDAGPPAPVRPDDGGVRRLPHPRRPPHRAGARRDRGSGPDADNTVVVVVSDNGCSAEGGPNGTWNQLRHYISDEPDDIDDELAHIDDLGGFRSSGHYPWGWALAGNTPFRRWKRYTFEGGVRDPFIIAWPAGIADPGGLRHQYAHAVDVFPTLLDLLGVDAPDGAQGRAAALGGRRDRCGRCWPTRTADEVHDHAVLRVLGEPGHVRRRVEGRHRPRQPADRGRARRHGGQQRLRRRRVAAVRHAGRPRRDRPISPPRTPSKLAELVALWDDAAARNQVLPIDDSRDNRIAQMHLPWLDVPGHVPPAAGRQGPRGHTGRSSAGGLPDGGACSTGRWPRTRPACCASRATGSPAGRGSWPGARPPGSDARNGTEHRVSAPLPAGSLADRGRHTSGPWWRRPRAVGRRRGGGHGDHGPG